MATNANTGPSAPSALLGLFTIEISNNLTWLATYRREPHRLAQGYALIPKWSPDYPTRSWNSTRTSN